MHVTNVQMGAMLVGVIIVLTLVMWSYLAPVSTIHRCKVALCHAEWCPNCHVLLQTYNNILPKLREKVPDVVFETMDIGKVSTYTLHKYGITQIPMIVLIVRSDNEETVQHMELETLSSNDNEELLFQFIMTCLHHQ